MYQDLDFSAFKPYQAPDCCFCESVAGAIVCASGNIGDWEYDDNGI